MGIPTAKCPSCGKLVSQVHFEEVNAQQGLFDQGTALRSLAYVCPECRTVLSVQIDPIAVRSDVCNHVDQTVASLAQQVADLRNQCASLEHQICQALKSRG